MSTGVAVSTTVDLEREVLADNDELATGLRHRFRAAGVAAVNLLSSPGSGKTELLTTLMRRLVADGVRVAALVGDCATDNDARRLAASGAPVRQVVTGGMCHLEAGMIGQHLTTWEAEGGPALADLDVLFLENVGNLVCPAGFDLGETARWVLLSVTEGEDKPRKYPAAFSGADLAVISKIDLAGPCNFDRAAATASLAAVGAHTVVEVSSTTGVGLAQLTEHLDLLVMSKPSVVPNERQ